jgi:uncharacterized tellurite resistance protein B-like protein
MGFLDRLFGAREAPTDPQYLLIECMVDVMLADGDIAEAEIDALRRAMKEHEYFASLSEDDFEAHVSRARKQAETIPKPSRRIEHLADHLPGRAYRLAAYALACQVAVADRTITPTETSYLEELRRAFMLDEASAASILSGARARAGLLSAEDSQRQALELTPVYLDCMGGDGGGRWRRGRARSGGDQGAPCAQSRPVAR